MVASRSREAIRKAETMRSGKKKKVRTTGNLSVKVVELTSKEDSFDSLLELLAELLVCSWMKEREEED